MPMLRTTGLAALGAAAMAALPAPTLAHPHIWADARMELDIKNGAVVAMQHVWRFDDIFSATVMIEADMNGDSKLDDEELETIGQVIKESTAEYDFFQVVKLNGEDIQMVPPDKMIVDWRDNRLLVLFRSETPRPLPLSGDLSFGVYDPTFYTAIDFANSSMMTSEGLPARCQRNVVYPDPDKAIEENQAMLDESFWETTDFSDLSGLLSTRLVVHCEGSANG